MISHALKSFWKCYERLPAHVQNPADKKFALFKTNPRHASLGFSKKGGVYTVEIGRSYRALAREQNGHHYWFWTGTHEEYNKFQFEISPVQRSTKQSSVENPASSILAQPTNQQSTTRYDAA